MSPFPCVRLPLEYKLHHQSSLYTLWTYPRSHEALLDHWAPQTQKTQSDGVKPISAGIRGPCTASPCCHPGLRVCSPSLAHRKARAELPSPESLLSHLPVSEGPGFIHSSPSQWGSSLTMARQEIPSSPALAVQAGSSSCCTWDPISTKNSSATDAFLTHNEWSPFVSRESDGFSQYSADINKYYTLISR